MDLVLALHSHLPYVLNHGRWPHGTDWLCEAAVDTYLPLIEMLNALETESVPAPINVGVTPILANQLDSGTFVKELDAFLRQRLTACDEAIDAFETTAESHLVPIAQYWRGRLGRLQRLFERMDGNLIGALAHHEAAGRIEIMSSAATHGFLPLLAREESIRLQLGLGRSEHVRLFGHEPNGCWVPECAYRPRGPWQPHARAPFQPSRPGIEEHLGQAGYQYFFSDAHLAQAGRTLGLYLEPDFPDGAMWGAEDALDLPAARSPYRPYRVSPRRGQAGVVTLVRDPVSSRQVWSRYHGYPGDGTYLEFHKIRFPGGLKLWRVTDSDLDLGLKRPYDPNIARARCHHHAIHYASLLGELAEATDGDLIVAPFDTELFGHWWFEGVDFLGDVYRQLGRRPRPTATTAARHLAKRPPSAAVELVSGSWGANGDFSKWLNPETEWTWLRLWAAEERFWSVAASSLGKDGTDEVVAQAARELLLAQSSDWQFIISSATAADYAARRFTEHADHLDRLLDGLEGAGGVDSATHELAAELRVKNDVFPSVLPAVRAALQPADVLSPA
jgi:1,4-alpha-glucan branching enzyme